jgi:hypothetical protein
MVLYRKILKLRLQTFNLLVIALFSIALFFIMGTTASGKEAGRFELISISRVNKIESHSAGNQAFYWKDNIPVNGVLIILRLLNPEPITLFSTDFSLGYEDKAGIPRSPCIGLSFGIDNPDQILNSTWMLGGSVSRTWTSKGKSYFGILFEAPKKAKEFKLYYATPLFESLKSK